MATQRVMLCSVKDVKLTGAISENIDDKYISAAIWEAQEFKLETILGHRLIERLKTLIRTNAIESGSAYEHLANLCSNYLAYQAMAILCLTTSFKITNAGVVSTPDDKVVNAGMKDINVVQQKYQSYADAKILALQRYLIDNRTSFPELNENTKHEQRPNLHTMENCGINLGGPRGKIIL